MQYEQFEVDSVNGVQLQKIFKKKTWLLYRDVEPPTVGHVESPDDCHPGMSLNLLSYFSTKALPWGLAALGVFTGSKLLLFPIQVPPPLRTSQDKTSIKIIPPADLQDPAGLCLCLCLCNYDLGEHLEVYKHIGKIRSFWRTFVSLCSTISVQESESCVGVDRSL